jgi:hypothetical protein
VRVTPQIVAAALLALSSLAGCGRNEAARGLPSAAPENASPVSKKELQMSESQRDAQVEKQLQEREIQNFDAAQAQQQKDDAKK